MLYCSLLWFTLVFVHVLIFYELSYDELSFIMLNRHIADLKCSVLSDSMLFYALMFVPILSFIGFKPTIYLLSGLSPSFLWCIVLF